MRRVPGVVAREGEAVTRYSWTSSDDGADCRDLEDAVFGAIDNAPRDVTSTVHVVRADDDGVIVVALTVEIGHPSWEGDDDWGHWVTTLMRWDVSGDDAAFVAEVDALCAMAETR